MADSATFSALCGAALYLLSRYAREPSPHLATLVQEHLQWLSEHPCAAELPELQATCGRLAVQWRQGNGSQDLPPPPPSLRSQGDPSLH